MAKVNRLFPKGTRSPMLRKVAAEKAIEDLGLEKDEKVLHALIEKYEKHNRMLHNSFDKGNWRRMNNNNFYRKLKQRVS